MHRSAAVPSPPPSGSKANTTSDVASRAATDREGRTVEERPSFVPAVDEKLARMFAKIRPWIRAARPLAFGNLAPNVLFGAALAIRRGAASEDIKAEVALALLWTASLQVVILYANDYFDRETDSKTRTLFSGGSGVLVEGLLDPRALQRAIGIAIGVLAITTIWVGTVAAWTATLALPAALLLIYLYTAPPFQMSHRGGGEWLQGAGTGIVLPAFGYICVAHAGASIPWSLFAAPLLFGVAGNISTAMPDLAADSAANKRSLPVRALRRFGTERQALTVSLACITLLDAVGFALVIFRQGTLGAASTLLIGAPAILWLRFVRRSSVRIIVVHALLALVGLMALVLLSP